MLSPSTKTGTPAPSRRGIAACSSRTKVRARPAAPVGARRSPAGRRPRPGRRASRRRRQLGEPALWSLKPCRATITARGDPSGDQRSPASPARPLGAGSRRRPEEQRCQEDTTARQSERLGVGPHGEPDHAPDVVRGATAVAQVAQRDRAVALGEALTAAVGDQVVVVVARRAARAAPAAGGGRAWRNRSSPRVTSVTPCRWSSTVTARW